MFTKNSIMYWILLIVLGYFFGTQFFRSKPLQMGKNNHRVKQVSNHKSFTNIEPKSLVKDNLNSSHTMHKTSLKNEEILTDRQKKIIQKLSQPYPSLSQLLPTHWTPSKIRSQSNQVGLIGNTLAQAIRHAQQEGFIRNKNHELPILNGLGHEIRLEIIEARVVGAQITFAPQASSADWMLMTTMLIGHMMNNTLKPSELYTHRIGQWTLPDKRTVLYQLHTQSGAFDGNEHTFISAYIRLGQPIQ
jgi:hypothetical protein